MQLRYSDNNVSGSVALFEVMAEFGFERSVSSSATVYGVRSWVLISCVKTLGVGSRRILAGIVVPNPSPNRCNSSSRPAGTR